MVIILECELSGREVGRVSDLTNAKSSVGPNMPPAPSPRPAHLRGARTTSRHSQLWAGRRAAPPAATPRSRPPPCSPTAPPARTPPHDSLMFSEKLIYPRYVVVFG